MMAEVEALTLEELEAATSTKRELDCLRHLHKKLSHVTEQAGDCPVLQTDEELFEEEFFAKTLDEEDPFPSKQFSDLCSTQEELNRFTHYLFERRYGWSEGLQCDGKKPRIHRLGSVVTSMEEERNYKSSMNEVLDDFIRWFKHQPVSQMMVECLQCCICGARDKPVVRNQTYVHIMEWMRLRSHDLTTDKFYMVKNLIISGLTDVWSKIRNSCASRLSPVVERLSLTGLENFFTELSRLCLCPETSWQAKEGAIMGVHVIIKRFHWTGGGPEESWFPKSPRHEYMLKFGQQELKSIPEFISENIRGLIYPMLAHPQLTIRENAIKTFSSYMLRCDAKETLSAFHDAVVELCKGTKTSLDDPQNLPHLAALRSDFRFMDAYNAEGLLGICLFLVKHIPATQLLPNWSQYFSTFSLYLMHPASTVRQATSNVFKYLVAKDSSHPVTLKLILHDLSRGWTGDVKMMTQPVGLDTSHLHRPSVNAVDIGQSGAQDESYLATAWEWREGRLFAYELILKFLIKNHWLYTFGPSSSGMPRLLGSMDEGTLSSYSRDRPNTPLNMLKRSAGSLMRGRHSPNPMVMNQDDPLHPDVSIKQPRHLSVSTSTPTEEIPANVMNIRRSSDENDSGQFLTVKQRMQTDAALPIRMTASPRTMRKHFSFYESRGGGRDSPSLDTQHHHHMTRSLSLLSQVKHLDTQRLNLHEIKENSHGQGEPAVPRLDVPHLSTILHQMLLQTIEATADPQWEVRRMGQQVLPYLTEVIRWFDIQHLVTLWDQHLGQAATVMTYGACMALRQTVAHAGRLIPLLSDPPTTWQISLAAKIAQMAGIATVGGPRHYSSRCLHTALNTDSVASRYMNRSVGSALIIMRNDVEMCCDTVKTITDPVTRHINRWSASVTSILSRPITDRLSLVAIHTLIVAHTHFSFPSDKKHAQEKAVGRFIRTVFLQSHPELTLARELSKGINMNKFSTPLEGFLSCNVKESFPDNPAVPLEKQLLQTMICAGCFTDFIKTCDISNIIDILPVILCYIRLSAENMDECRLLVECVGAMAMKTGNYLLQDGHEERRRHVMTTAGQTLRHLADMITLKDIDVPVLRHLLDIYLVFTTQLWDSRQLLFIFQAIVTRSNTLVNLKLLSSHPKDDDLFLMSNDIPQTVILNDDSETSSDEDNAADHVPDTLLEESGVLNSSGNSDGHVSGCGRHSAMSGPMDGRIPSPVSSVDEGSDWDDWSDEEDQSVLSEVFGSFLNRLKTCYLASGKSGDFQREFLKLGQSDRKLLKGFL